MYSKAPLGDCAIYSQPTVIQQHFNYHQLPRAFPLSPKTPSRLPAQVATQKAYPGITRKVHGLLDISKLLNLVTV